MAVQPLSPATHRRLGGPLPHQLSNGTRAHLCAIKSLAFKPCDSNASCGISVCFRTLSPSHRQIAHALLTRPPLIILRREITVRLECVKHAASVHPEPGSNSLKKLYINHRSELKSFFQSFFLSFLLLVLCVQSLLTRSLIRSQFVVVQFSRTVVFCALVSSAHVVYHTFSKLSILFFNFFHFF